jgi:hypothetical protein
MTPRETRRRHDIVDVDALIDDSALPIEHRELVRGLIRQARLPAPASADVAEELLCHFEDGLAGGVSPEALVTRFGSIGPAAELIRRGQRRRHRAEPWRRYVLLAAASVAAFTVTTYAWSAMALHGAEPLTATVRATAYGSDELAWTRADAAVLAARERARSRLRGASPQARHATIAAILGEAAALRRDVSLETELAAIAIVHEALSALGDGDIDADIDGALARVLAPSATLLRASAVRAAYDDLLDRVYSGDGDNARVTAKGLRVLQSLGGKTSPSVAAVVLEPAYFVSPARRSEVEREIDAMAADVEQAGGVPHADGALQRLRMRQAALEREPMRALRYFPITATVSRLAAAAERARSAARMIAIARGRPVARAAVAK